jgi:hypothetical protein
MTPADRVFFAPAQFVPFEEWHEVTPIEVASGESPACARASAINKTGFKAISIGVRSRLISCPFGPDDRRNTDVGKNCLGAGREFLDPEQIGRVTAHNGSLRPDPSGLIAQARGGMSVVSQTFGIGIAFRERHEHECCR